MHLSPSAKLGTDNKQTAPVLGSTVLLYRIVVLGSCSAVGDVVPRSPFLNCHFVLCFASVLWPC